MLNAPPGTECLSFDVQFLSEEFPEYVGSSFNDTFTVEYGESSLAITGNEVTSPTNFAYDTEGNAIGVNTVFGVETTTNTTYDGTTPRMHVSKTLDSIENIRLIFTIQDLGDSAYDSAAFIDNFVWRAGAGCPGNGSLVDTDGDGLLDIWEINGIDTDGDGKYDLDLPGMGADPKRKDIFLEIDYMKGFLSGNTKPSYDAMKMVQDEFARNKKLNINLHFYLDDEETLKSEKYLVDFLGSQNQCYSIDHEDYYKDSIEAKEVYKEKADKLKQERKGIFHHVIFARNINKTYELDKKKVEGSVAGVRPPTESSFMIIATEAYGKKLTDLSIAKTLAHELGHAIGLNHGGDDGVTYKPNYISLMNYYNPYFTNNEPNQIRFSDFDFPPIDENNLNEGVGLGLDTSILEEMQNLRVQYYCGNSSKLNESGSINIGNTFVDWNCNGSSDGLVKADINNSPDCANEYGKILPKLTILDDGNRTDWERMDLTADGAIGNLGQINPGPIEAVGHIEPTVEELSSREKMYEVDLTSKNLILYPGLARNLSINILNKGIYEETFSIIAQSDKSWATLGVLPTQITLASKMGKTFNLPVKVPGNVANDTDSIKIKVINIDANDSWDTTEASIYVLEPFVDVPGSHWAMEYIGALALSEITKGCGTSPKMFCPDAVVTRDQMAVFLERGIKGSVFAPPAATGTMFNDVPAANWAADWIEQLANDGITSGCGSNNYCPSAQVSRDQMAVFLLRSRYGTDYTPPSATGEFSDVPTSHWAAAWIEQLAKEGITSGCSTSPKKYCPGAPVTRAQMAVFLVRTFGL